VITRRFVAATAVAALGYLCVSCEGTAPGLSSVTGKLVCNGQPAAGAVLSFHRQGGDTPAPKDSTQLIPSAVVKDDGSFTVETHPLGFGAAPGKYAILVQWPENNDPVQARSAGKPKSTVIKGKKVDMTRHDKLDSVTPDRLKGRYSDASKPLLEKEVKPGPNDLGTLEIELKN
jgi:hypothetical protein